MTEPNKTGPQTEQIQTGIGRGFLHMQFGGKPFIHVLIEMIKNARDWRATTVAISTVLRELVEIVDDGDGMDFRNRAAFGSINMTTAGGPRQSGKFCTGTKQMLFSHAKSVEVLTASKETPQLVHRFSFEADAYEDIVLKGGTIEAESMPKSVETWPFSHPFGTRLRYKLRDPRSRGLKRGADLAAELSARLPMKFADIITVDALPLPPKEIIGRLFTFSDPTSSLGDVAFEIYRPKKVHPDDELRFTSHEVGEVPILHLLRLLKDPDLRSRYPMVFAHKEVCGTVTAGFLRDYSNEDRTTFKPGIVDDPKLLLLLKLMERQAPAVEKFLQLDLQTHAGDQIDVQPFADKLRRLYDPEGKRTRETILVENGGADEDPPGTPPGKERNPPAMSLKVGQEFEPGERIECRVGLRKDLAQIYAMADVQWHTDRSLATNGRSVEPGIYEMRAESLGTGKIRADIPGTPHSIVQHYEIVGRRIFRLNYTKVSVRIGSSLMLAATNLDRIKSNQPSWHVQYGKGELSGEGGCRIFTPTQIGREVVSAVDRDDPSTVASCDITILPGTDEGEGLLIPIREDLFRLQTMILPGNRQFPNPVNITPSFGTSKIHLLTINSAVPAFIRAQAEGDTDKFLSQAIAFEYARFVKDREFLNKQEGGRVDVREVSALIQDIQALSYEVLAELQRAQ